MTRRGPAWLAEALLLFAVAFGPIAFGAVEPWSRAVLLGALYLLPAACAWSGLLESRTAFRGPLFFAAAAVTTLGALQWLGPQSAGSPAPLAPFTVSRALTGQAVVLWGGYACLVVSAPAVLSDRKAAHRFAWTLLGLGVFIALAGIVQRSFGNTAYYGIRPVRPGRKVFGPFTNRDHAASLMGVCAFVGLGAVSARFRSFRAGLSIGRIGELAATQALLLVAAATMIFGLIQTQSRGAFLSLVATFFLVCLASIRFVPSRRGRWIACGALLLLSAAFACFLRSRPDLIGGLLTTPENSVAYRLSMDRTGWRLFLDFPIFGTGLGAAIDAFAPYKEGLIAGIVDHVHNDWLELLIQTGAVGSALVLLAAGRFGMRASRAWIEDDSRETRLLRAGALAAAAFFTIHSLVDFSFQIPANAVVFLTIVSFLDALENGEETGGARGEADV